MDSNKQIKKEHQQEKFTYIKPENYSNEISEMIDETLKNKHKVWLGSDWHLWHRTGSKGSKTCKKRDNFDEIIKNISNVEEDDMLIFLGDLVDGEFSDKENIKKVIKGLPPKNKVFIRGNNDLFDASFYKSLGFKYVTYKFVWHNILFSHPPLEHDYSMNIHGHIHFNYKDNNKRKAQYWVPYNNHICVFDKTGKLTELKDVMNSVREYSKHIEVDEEKVEELHKKRETGVFEYAMSVYMYENTDPFNFFDE